MPQVINCKKDYSNITFIVFGDMEKFFKHLPKILKNIVVAGNSNITIKIENKK